MTARIWRGTVHRDDGDAYAAYILDTGFAQYTATPGNRGAWLLRNDGVDRTEFVAFTLWDSLDAIRSFAGDEAETSVSYPEDDRYLVGPPSVTHYEVAGDADRRSS